MVKTFPRDPGGSCSGMGTRSGNGRCDNLVCTVEFIWILLAGSLSRGSTRRSGGRATRGSLFRFIGSGERRRSSRFLVSPRGHFRPTNIAPLSRLLSLLPPCFFHHLPSLFLSFTLSWAASNIFLSSPSRPWINYSPTLNISTFFAGMGPPSRDRPQKRRERMISIDRRVTWKELTAVPDDATILQFFGKRCDRRRRRMAEHFERDVSRYIRIKRECLFSLECLR